MGTKKLKDLGKGVVVSKRCADRSRVIDEAIEEDPSRQEWAGFALFLEPLLTASRLRTDGHGNAIEFIDAYRSATLLSVRRLWI